MNETQSDKKTYRHDRAKGEFGTFWRYDLSAVKGEGWGYAVLTADGLFFAITDYGNWCHHWASTGEKDFRDFILKLDGDYFARKLVRPDDHKVYDSETTLREAKNTIAEYLGTHDSQLALEALERHNNLADQSDFDEWCQDENSQLDSPSDCYCAMPSAEFKFVEGVFLKRIKEAIRAQKEAEKP